jgi:excisionase family DNA binding protein
LIAVEVVNPSHVTADAVLTLEEAAALFKLSPDAIAAAVEHNDLPGRRFGNDWRFSKAALLDWLGRGEPTRRRKGR